MTLKKTKINNKLLIVLIATLLLNVLAYFLFNSKPVVVTNPTIKIPESPISTIIVPHHDLVAKERDLFFQKVSNEFKAKTIILVSPNHFDTGTSNIITTSKTWSLVNSKILPESNLINSLVKDSLVKDEEPAFIREHGITNILTDINKYLPDAKIVPIIIKENTAKEDVLALTKKIYELCPKDCKVVASVDFSHYQPGSLAEIHDSLSIRALTSQSDDLILKTEVDSPLSLLFASNWAKLNKTNNFQVDLNTNSGKIVSSSDTETTSYVFGWYDKEKAQSVERGQTFVIGGDMMFDRLIEFTSQKDLKEAVKNLGDRLFWGTDLSLVNLEGPISAKKTKPNYYETTMSFNFPIETPSVLKYLHINTAGLANNHTYNQGELGFTNTKKVLADVNIQTFGSQIKFDESSIQSYVTNGEKISVIAVNLLDKDYDLIPAIKKEKELKSFVIVYPHWGSEYQEIHSKNQEDLAKSWIDVGADLIIGSHPHVVQDAQMYKGKPIFYSLGNLLFDQLFSKETQQGLIVAGEIYKEKLRLVILPTVSKKLQPELMRDTEKFNIVKKIKADLGFETINNDYGYDSIEIAR